MFEFLRPKGSADPKVYWIRRGIVLGMPLLLIIVAVWALWPGSSTTVTNSGPSNSNEYQWFLTPSPSATASASPSASSSATASPSTSASVSATPKPSAAPTKATNRVCDGRDIAVTLEGNQFIRIYQEYKVKLNFRNKTDVPCTLSLTHENFRFRVLSGNDTFYDTSTCKKWFPTLKDKKLEPGASVSTDFSWVGKRVYSSCNTGIENYNRPASGSTYTFKAYAGLTGGQEASMVFLVF